MQQAQFPLPQPPLQRPAGGGKAALLYGLIFGGAISLLDILYTVLVDNGMLAWYYNLLVPLERLPYFLNYTLSSIIVGLPIYILLLVACFLAGILAARSARRIAPGVLAGLLVGALFLILDLIIGDFLLNFLVVFPQMASSLSAEQLVNFERDVLISSTIYTLIANIILLGLGVLVGFLGALIGNSGNPQTPAAPRSPYPYAGQPPVYGYPSVQPAHSAQLPVYPPAQPGRPSAPPSAPEQ
jgi:hypothetical protein